MSLLAAPDSDEDFAHLLPPPLLDVPDANTTRRAASERDRGTGAKVEISYDASAAVPRFVEVEDMRAEAGLDAMEAALHYMDADPAEFAASMAHTHAQLAARTAERQGGGSNASASVEAGGDALERDRAWIEAMEAGVEGVELWLEENPRRAQEHIRKMGLSLRQHEEESSDDATAPARRRKAMDEQTRERRNFEAVSAMYKANERGATGDGDSDGDDDGGFRGAGRSIDFDSSEEGRGSLGGRQKLYADMSDRELRRYVRDNYPWRQGESYTFPAPYAIMEYEEKKRREWQQTREFKLLGAPAKSALPAFLSGFNITDEMLEEAERKFLHPNGTFNLARLRQALADDIEKVADVVMDDAAKDSPHDVDPMAVYNYLQTTLEDVEDAIEDGSVERQRQREEAQITTGPVFEDGYDMNQFRRPFHVGAGAFADGKRFDWVPAIQAQFWQCVRHGKTTIPMLQSYLDKGALINGFCPVWNHATALHYAAWRGHRDTCAQLLELGANVTARASCGSSALHGAAFWGHLKVIKLLVAHGADLWERRHEDGRTPMDVAESGSSRMWDRSRAIVWMRREMGLENVTYTAYIPKKKYEGDPHNRLDPEPMEYFTIPAGKYVPSWEREEEDDEDDEDEDEDEGGIPEEGKAASTIPYKDVYEMFKDQRAQESAQLQLEATAEHLREQGGAQVQAQEPAAPDAPATHLPSNATNATAPEPGGEDADDDSEGLLDWDDSSAESFKGMQGGTGQEYGRKSMQSKELRKLGVSRRGKF